MKKNTDNASTTTSATTGTTSTTTGTTSTTTGAIIEITIYEDATPVVLGLTKTAKIREVERTEQLTKAFIEEHGLPSAQTQMGLTLVPLVRTIDGEPVEYGVYDMARFIDRFDVRVDVIDRLGEVLAAIFHAPTQNQPSGQAHPVVSMPQ